MLDTPKVHPSLVEMVAAAICDTPMPGDSEHRKLWKNWIADVTEGETEDIREMAVDWVAARRLEAEAALAALRPTMEAIATIAYNLGDNHAQDLMRWLDRMKAEGDSAAIVTAVLSRPLGGEK